MHAPNTTTILKMFTALDKHEHANVKQVVALMKAIAVETWHFEKGYRDPNEFIDGAYGTKWSGQVLLDAHRPHTIKFSA